MLTNKPLHTKEPTRVHSRYTIWIQYLVERTHGGSPVLHNRRGLQYGWLRDTTAGVEVDFVVSGKAHWAYGYAELQRIDKRALDGNGVSIRPSTHGA